MKKSVKVTATFVLILGSKFLICPTVIASQANGKYQTPEVSAFKDKGKNLERNVVNGAAAAQRAVGNAGSALKKEFIRAEKQSHVKPATAKPKSKASAEDLGRSKFIGGSAIIRDYSGKGYLIRTTDQKNKR